MKNKHTLLLFDHMTFFVPPESEEEIPAYVSLLQNIEKSFDLSTSCGYVTLLNLTARKRSKLRKMPNLTTLASFEMDSSDSEEEDLKVTESMPTVNETSEELRSGISVTVTSDDLSERPDSKSSKSSKRLVDVSPPPVTPPSSPFSRNKSLNSLGDLEIKEQWVPLNLCYGLPLFDNELNRQVCRTVSISHLFLISVYFHSLFK